MSEPTLTPQEAAQRFAQLVMMQAQNILYLLGRIPGPHGELPPPQLHDAKMLIDQLEMLQVKTKGNLSEQEAKLLENAMTQMRLAFVEASGGTSPSMMPSRGHDAMEEYAQAFEEAAPAAAPAPHPEPAPAAKPEPKPEPVEDKKKYFKSYG